MFYIQNYTEAKQVSEELNEFIQDILTNAKNSGIFENIFIPQLDLLISSSNSICSVEAIELKRFEPLPELTFTKLY